MNAEKRARLSKAIAYILEARKFVDIVCDQESDSVDNYPENLQSTDTYEKMESAVDQLNEALELLESAEDNIRSAMA